jgi:hypothetical protein
MPEESGSANDGSPQPETEPGRCPSDYIKRLSNERVTRIRMRLREAYHSKCRADLLDDCVGEAWRRTQGSQSCLEGAPTPTTTPSAAWYKAVEDALVAFATGAMLAAVVSEVNATTFVRPPRQEGVKWEVRHLGDLSELDHAKERGAQDVSRQERDGLALQTNAGKTSPQAIAVVTMVGIDDPDIVEDESAQNVFQDVDNTLDHPKSASHLAEKLRQRQDAWNGRKTNTRSMVVQVYETLWYALRNEDPNISENIILGTGQFNQQLLLSLLKARHPNDGWTLAKVRLQVAKLRRDAWAVGSELGTAGLLPFELPDEDMSTDPRVETPIAHPGSGTHEVDDERTRS